jgi:lipopolysaccharide export system permease protein
VKIVARYILREHVGPLLFALSALTSLLLLNFVAKRFGDLVGKGLPWTVIAEFLSLSVPFTLAMTLPMAVLVATLHAFSRLASENEITAFKASGVSARRLMVPVIFASIGLTFFMVWFNDQVLPRANHRLATLQSDIARVKPTLALSEQVINEVVPRQLFLRAARVISGTNQLRDVTIYDLSVPTKRRTIIADSGLLTFNETGEDLLLRLYHGSTTELGDTDPKRLQRNFFEEDVIRVRGVATRLDRNDDRMQYKSDREMSVCEMTSRVQEAKIQRDSAWARLLIAEGENTARPVAAESVPLGVGGYYCRAVTWIGSVIAPREAVAATLPQGTSATATGRRIDPATADPSALAGMVLEVQMLQGTIDQYRVEIEKKFAIATACFVFVLIGAPVALRFPRGGVGLTIGVSLGVFGLYYVGLLAGEALADRDVVGPALAMWSTNILLTVVGLGLIARIGSEGATSRGSETSDWWRRLFARVRRRRPA